MKKVIKYQIRGQQLDLPVIDIDEAWNEDIAEGIKEDQEVMHGDQWRFWVDEVEVDELEAIA